MPEIPATRADDIDIARERMRHLTPWHVEPLPAMHAADGTPDAPLTPAERERSKGLAALVLVVQICNAGAIGALQQ